MKNPFGPAAYTIFKEKFGIETPDELAEKIARLKLPLTPTPQQPFIFQLLSFYKGLFVTSIDPAYTRRLQWKLIEWGASQLDTLEVPFIEGAEEQFPPTVTLLPKLKGGRAPFPYKVPLKTALTLSLSLAKGYVKGGYVYITYSEAREVTKRWFESEFHKRLELLKDLELPPVYHKWYSEVVSKDIGVDLKVGGLVPGAFPPCITRALQGVPAGTRNFSITVFLTSFLSYARLNIFGKKKKITTPQELQILKDEIVPLIFEAGNKCTPPLFEERPHEVKIIWYTLGFGYTDSPSLEDSGNSPWYFPPNCEKIRASAPFLCPMSEECEGIKNPLVYYVRKIYAKRKAKKAARASGGEADD